MSLNYDKVKRLKVLDNLVIAKGKNKIILINPNTKRHITVKTDEKKDIVDVHITEESEPKKYEPVLRQKWNETKKQLIELLKNAKVSLNDPTLDGCILAMLPVNIEKKPPKVFVSEGRNLTLSKEMSEQIGKKISESYLPHLPFPIEKEMLNYLILVWKLWANDSQPQRDLFKNIFIKPQEAERATFTKALVFDKNGKFTGFLIKRFENYFFVPLTMSDRLSEIFETKFGRLKNKLDEVLGLNSI